jgi:precorrin-6Y C5,15-methyltransferase (decarboxylating)
MNNKIKIIGIGDNGKDSLLPFYLKWIAECEVLVGGERHLQFFPEFQGERIVIKGGFQEWFAPLQTSMKRTVILASGDPLFFGIGAYAAKHLEVELYPNLSSIQLAFARIGESWQDAYVDSIHGRSMKGLAQRLDGKEKAVLLTDSENTPEAIARYLQRFGMKEYRLFVAENLGGANERTGWYELDQLAAEASAGQTTESAFSHLNVVILRRKHKGPVWSIGIDDDQFAQRKPDKGLITKKEVRILSLAQMSIQLDSTVWDIGTCTGSVAIEAARIARQGKVYAIEKNEGDLQNCLDNSLKFRTDITAVLGKAPQGLGAFPDPDSVFIGGSGGEMEELLHQCCTRLKPGGAIVLNAVTIESLYESTQAFAKEGFAVQITMVQVSRSKPILDMTRFEALNPVYIITAKHAVLPDKQQEG